MRIRLDSRRAPTRRYACIGLIALVATLLSASSARSIESARELSIYCRIVERGVKGTGRHVYIPHTREALTCWGYMQAMQDLSVLADGEGDRIMGACPPEKMTTLLLIQLFGRYARAHPGGVQGNAAVAVFRKPIRAIARRRRPRVPASDRNKRVWHCNPARPALEPGASLRLTI